MVVFHWSETIGWNFQLWNCQTVLLGPWSCQQQSFPKLCVQEVECVRHGVWNVWKSQFLAMTWCACWLVGYSWLETTRSGALLAGAACGAVAAAGRSRQQTVQRKARKESRTRRGVGNEMAPYFEDIFGGCGWCYLVLSVGFLVGVRVLGDVKFGPALGSVQDLRVLSRSFKMLTVPICMCVIHHIYIYLTYVHVKSHDIFLYIITVFFFVLLWFTHKTLSNKSCSHLRPSLWETALRHRPGRWTLQTMNQKIRRISQSLHASTRRTLGWTFWSMFLMSSVWIHFLMLLVSRKIYSKAPWFGFLMASSSIHTARITTETRRPWRRSSCPWRARVSPRPPLNRQRFVISFGYDRIRPFLGDKNPRPP